MRDLDRIFKGLADPTRLRILNLLLHGELCVCDLQYVLRASQPNISRHLTYLKASALVRDRREGARIYYRLAQPGAGAHKPLFAFLRELFRTSPALSGDSRRLKMAMATGSCTVSEWHPYAALKERASARA